MFMETSAKAGHNVKSLFKKIAMSLPGMEKENMETTAQSTSPFPDFLGQLVERLSLSRDRCHHAGCSRAAAEVPEASQCQC